jgi:two-component system chemotaxis response regulator CheY
VVDESPFIRKLIGDIFRRSNYEVCGEAETVSKAAELCAELKPNLVTVGMVMTDMNGLDAIKAIRKVDEDARIIVVSSLGRETLINESLRLGAREFVVKPFRPSRILEAAKRAMSV